MSTIEQQADDLMLLRYFANALHMRASVDKRFKKILKEVEELIVVEETSFNQRLAAAKHLNV